MSVHVRGELPATLTFEFPTPDAAEAFFWSDPVMAGKIAFRVVEVTDWIDGESVRIAARDLRGKEIVS